MSFYCEPVFGNNFFAREEILTTLLKSAGDIKEGYRHNIALIGRGLIGKTSLLLHFLGIVKDDQSLVPVYINLKGTDFAGFADSFITMLLYHSLKKIKSLKRNDDLDYLRKCAAGPFPKTSDLIKRIKIFVEEENYDEAYSALWDLCTVLNSESGNFLILVLDEFSHILSFPVKRPFQILGQKIMVQQKTLFILSSSSTLTARKILSEKLSLLFGGFKVIDIGPFTPPSSKAFIQQQCKGIGLSDELKDFLLVFTGGHPFYLTSIIQKLKFAKQCGVERISSKYLSLLIAELLFDPGGVINQFFTDLTERLRSTITDKTIFDILKVFLKSHRNADIIKTCNISSIQLNNLLNELVEIGVVSKSGSLYAITDLAFKVWVEVKARPRNLCFDFIPQEDSSAYAKEVEEKISQFNAERKRRFEEKVVELVSSFKNDSFLIDQRMRMLPALNYVRQQRLNHNRTLITMQGKRNWLFVVSDSRVTEEDVDDILKRIKESKSNLARVILIAASDIDETATLLAKQNKFWIWNIDDLNRLFLFYKGYSAVIA